MSIELFRTVEQFRTACDGLRHDGRSVGLVPTMGALHRGHMALIEEATRLTSTVAVTIFVNPTQFGPSEDFARYPRDLEHDLGLCERAGATWVFAPPIAEMYPEGDATRVRVSRLTEHLCGASRPDHFEGVATIVTKLFVAAGPCTAVFGRKDYQQLKVIERMTRDLLLGVRIVPYPTVREADGLALSSRNAYLSPEERRQAGSIPRALAVAVERFGRGERSAAGLHGSVTAMLEAANLRIDYVTLADAEELQPWPQDVRLPERVLLAVAVLAGTTRLIDNVVLGEDPAPEGRAGEASR